MNTETVATAVTDVLGLIKTFLPIIGNNSAGSKKIGTVVDTLTALAPLVTDQVSVVYTGAKNVIASVSSHPATTPDQRASLAAFDKQVDDAWNAIEAQLDPDSQPGK